MKHIFKKILSVIGPSVLGFLGFSACEIIPDVTEYGTPNCNYKVDITVVDESGNHLEGIRVIHALMDVESGMSEKDYMMTVGKDTLLTDAKGKAVHTYNIFSAPKHSKVYFEDGNGTFRRDSMEFTPVKTGEGKGWYSGEWTISGTKKMKKN